MKNKHYSQAVWEIRKKYKRQYLTKKQLSEAFDLYMQGKGNKVKLKELFSETVRGMK